MAQKTIITPLPLLLLLFFTACSSGNNLAPGDEFCMDLDGDGYTGGYVAEDGDDSLDLAIVACSVSLDCDDDDNQTYPGAIETQDNSVDEDCDGSDSLSFSVDEPEEDPEEDPETTTCSGGNDPATFYRDVDGDGFGDDAQSQEACEQPEGYVSVGGDCNDYLATIYPGAQEVTGDPFDQDCNGDNDTMDCDVGDPEIKTYYADIDRDGYYNLENYVQTCMRPADNYYLYSEADSEGSCSDQNFYANPGMVGKDYGVIRYQLGIGRASGRGFNRTSQRHHDSNKLLAFNQALQLSPAAVSAAQSIITVTVDQYGHDEENMVPTFNEAFKHGDITRYFLGVNNDCSTDGKVDEDGFDDPDDDYENTGVWFNHCYSETHEANVGIVTYYPDNDGDGAGNANTTLLNRQRACRFSTVEDHVPNDLDCNDNDSTVYGTENDSAHKDYSNVNGNTEDYKGIDNDCDGSVDENYYYVDSTSKWTGTTALAGASFKVKEAGKSHKSDVYWIEYEPRKFTESDLSVKSGQNVGFVHNDSYEDSQVVGWHSTIVANKAFAQFWHGELKVDKLNNKTDLGDGMDWDSAECKGSTSRCTVKATLRLSGTYDYLEAQHNYSDGSTSDGHAISTGFADSHKRAVIWLRGFSLDAAVDKGIKIQDFIVRATLSDYDLDADPTADATFVLEMNSDSQTSWMGNIYFTVMVYDPDYIKVINLDSVDSGWSNGEDNDRFVNQTTTFDPSDLLRFNSIGSFNYTDPEDALNKTSRVGTVMNAWGLHQGGENDVKKLKAMSHAKKWDPQSDGTIDVTVKTKGVLYDADSDIKESMNESRSRIIICATNDVCKIKLNKKERNFNDPPNNPQFVEPSLN